ncbi:hypothetical protein EHS25_010289 [Saitozyma podzolica]|uniref:Uncharacterized protein n=1 Tax=Saitozyma podzolica TaxID=1890683 RepID=A0A427YJ72_9TREE|nr:hypothetical protein EHS25_010289 [Saitozyma podzolica]
MSSAKNYTIDDSQWSTPALSLSPGWNMLRTNGSDEYLNATQVEEMSPLLGSFWNSSISWTTSNGSSTTLSFVGTDIYAYGLSGPSQSPYIAQLDNSTVGTYTARAADTDYHHLLFSAHDLQDGVTHQLTLVNAQEGASLAFDYAVVTSVAAFESPQQLASASASLLAASSASAAAAAAASYSEALLNPNGYTAAQLASLTAVYHFHWNPPAYFVVVFGSLVGCLSLVAVSIMFLRSWVKDGSWRSIGSAIRERFGNRNRNRSGSGTGTGSERESETGSKHGDGESGSYLLKDEKRRPSSRVLNALRRGKISPPLHPENGAANVPGAERGSGTSAASSGDVQHGW